MEMNRRNFLQKVIITCSSVAALCLTLTKAALPERFMKYPGKLKALGNIASQSKWSG